MGAKRFAALYLLSGMGGILFSSLLSNGPSVGASTSIFGLNGAFISYIILNWKTMDPDRRCRLATFLIMSLMYNFMAGSGNPQID